MGVINLGQRGYIIKINPIAKGILVVPEENEFIKSAEFGI